MYCHALPNPKTYCGLSHKLFKGSTLSSCTLYNELANALNGGNCFQKYSSGSKNKTLVYTKPFKKGMFVLNLNKTGQK